MTRSPITIAPSMLSCDFANLETELKHITDAGADAIHLDVMDGHFVPNITFGPPVIKAMRPHTDLPFDVHLMIDPAAPYIADFAAAGADSITVHIETEGHAYRSLKEIKNLGKKAGIALNPATPTNVLDHIIPLVDLILIMTVNPGFGGQSYIPLEEKITDVRARISRENRPISLQVDGGITPETAKLVKAAGADNLVAGTAIFKGGAENYAPSIQALREA